ncbi:MAG: mandelate racemase/muconate lactonizing enzyme family protein [Actinobacteria bacterium]|nr:mandelate racemase/muconate lactonizing enzyme family protein [Actinomycetota bacterium]
MESNNVGTGTAAPGETHNGLTIRDIEVIALRAPLAREYRGSHYRMTHRATVITRVITEEGLVGEAYAGDEDDGLAAIVRILREEIAPAVRGLDAFAVERCWEAAFPVTFDILRDRRLGLVALAGLDAAIWDLVGKALGQPLWRLWGGYRQSLPMIVIGGYYPASLEELAEEMHRHRESGMAGIKFKVGGLSPEEDAKRVIAAREAAGDDFVIAIDANQGYTTAEALRLCRLLEGVGIRWFEEPVGWQNDRRGMRDVRMRGGIPVCAGQSEYSPSGCRDLIEAGSIDVCNFDASWSGGPTAWRRTAAIAHAAEVQMGHHEEPHIAAHLLASQPHGTYVECFEPDRDPFWWNLITNRPELVDGELTLPSAPGLGWELDWDYANRYRVEDQ